jgi:Heterokaryon incompatibility protein (HET)
MGRVSKRKRDSISNPSFSWSSPTYEHVALPTTTSIRILELQPGEGTETIACRLSVVEFAKAPPYEAISYAWGREADTRVINCDNRKLRVTANLRDALWRIRDPVEVKILWADAVCINQSDNEERGFQVRQMPQIYANALRVLVWIDVPSSAFKNFEDLFDFDSGKSPIGDGKQIVNASRILNEHISKLEIPGVRMEDLDPDTSVVASALCQLFDSPWFTRLWVVQEVGMAKSILAMIGDASIDFEDLIRFILRLEKRTLLMDQLGLFIAGKSNVYTSFPARSTAFHPDVDDDYNFLEMLEVTRNKKASDPRDYVYALLGHPSALINGSPIVQPDYNKPAQEVFFEVTMKIMDQSQSLRVLSAVHHHDGALDETTSSSWIPTWSRDVAVLSLGVYQDHYFDVEYDASAGMPVFWNLIEPSRSLDVCGFVFDVVEEYLETEVLSDDGSLVLKEVDEVISAVLQFKNQSSNSPEETLLAVGQTLTAGFRNQNSTQFSAEFTAFRLYLALEAAKQGKEINEALFPEGMDTLRDFANGRNVDDIYWSASRFCTGRKVFCTQQGMFGLGPANLRKGDLCCVLFGAQVPFILRSVGMKYKLVGESYVHGIMKGEAVVDWMIWGKYEKQIFTLV